MAPLIESKDTKAEDIHEDNISIQDASIPAKAADTSQVEVDWSPEEELKAKRRYNEDTCLSGCILIYNFTDLVPRFDFMVLPLLMLGFFSQQIDRGNM